MSGPEDELKLPESEMNASVYGLGARSHYDSSGVDRALIRSYLKRSPTECLQALEEMLELAESARRVDESVR